MKKKSLMALIEVKASLAREKSNVCCGYEREKGGRGYGY